MFFYVFLCFAVISAAVADVAHLGYNYEPPTEHSGYNYDAPAQGSPTELHSEYVAPHHSSVKTEKIVASYVNAASAPAPVRVNQAATHFQAAFETAPAATHLHAVHAAAAAPAAKQFHQSYEFAPAATHVHQSFEAAPAAKQFHQSFEFAPAATYVHESHESAPVSKHLHETYEAAPAASHQKAVLTSYDAPTFIDTNALFVEATNDVGTVYGTNGGYVY